MNCVLCPRRSRGSITAVSAFCRAISSQYRRSGGESSQATFKILCERRTRWLGLRIAVDALPACGKNSVPRCVQPAALLISEHRKLLAMRVMERQNVVVFVASLGVSHKL